MQLSPLPCYLVPIRPKYSPRDSILKDPQPKLLPQRERTSFTSIQNYSFFNVFIHSYHSLLHLFYVKCKAVPLQAWSGPEGSRKLRFPDFMTTAQDGVKVVSLTHRPLFTPRKYSWYSFLLEAESTSGPQCDRKDFMSLKNPLTPTGIEPATFRFVAQHLNHCATTVAIYFMYSVKSRAQLL